ncbi:hypothetical protein NQ317_015097 [Molorchus minor]|uniref:Uncharacterized protein n=1 Tax=Molorchus minor TaxID=1323400 RepID=A0ABQ9K636_9CUCU|nr:hypothetical protein NQ317_015097 [Molorchus minor]
MEEVAFSDWPGQPVDLNSGNNPWMPAYGFQTPTALLERRISSAIQGSTNTGIGISTASANTQIDRRLVGDVRMKSDPEYKRRGFLESIWKPLTAML